jgi:hypothetical protein
MNRVEPGRREALFLLAGLGIFLGNVSPGFGWQTPHLFVAYFPHPRRNLES